MTTKEQAIHTRYIKVKIDGKRDLNPECRMYDVSHIIRRCTTDKHKAQYGKASSLRLWVTTVKNK